MIRPASLREDDGYRLGSPTTFRYQSNPKMLRLLKEYVRSAGFPPYEKTPDVPLDTERCRMIAREFEALDFLDERARAAYHALANEIHAQYDLLSEEVAFTPYGDGDPVPYQDSSEMMDDVLENRHLWVYTGGEDHALLTREANYMLRAVHDLFGHAANGFSFGPRGEENAWVEHSKAFSPLARAALTTETRGQNSFVNCGPYAHLPPKERPYAEQKGALLPDEFWLHPVVERAYKSEPGFLYVQ